MSDDLREALASAMEGVEPTPPTPEPAATSPEAVVQTPAAETQPASDGDSRPRDTNGRFAPKPEQAQATPSAESAPKEGQAAPAAQAADLSRPPASLSAPVKAMWATLPPEVQADFARRERETDAGFRERGEKLSRLEPIAKALDPVRTRLQVSGVTDEAYVSSLVQADEALRGPNKVQAFLELGRQLGIQLPQGQPQGQAPQGQPSPEVQELRGQLQDLRSYISQQQADAQARSQAEVTGNIQAFFDDPKNIYATNVAGRMVQFLKSGQVEGRTPQERLQNAYEAACWADPTVRPLMAANAGGQAQSAQAAHAQRARGAAVSVTGAPTPGGSPTGSPPSRSLRGELEAAWNA